MEREHNQEKKSLWTINPSCLIKEREWCNCDISTHSETQNFALAVLFDCSKYFLPKLSSFAVKKKKKK